MFFPLFLRSLLAFVLFCLISGTGYLINDVVDIENDKRHPHKSKRPLASGQLKPSSAISAAVSIGAISLIISFLLNSIFGFIALFYLLLGITYSLFLKRLIILDVLIVSLGFVLRAMAGTVVIGVKMSSWLLICTIFLALFLVLGKRRHELVTINLSQQPESLQRYNPYVIRSDDRCGYYFYGFSL